MGLLNDATLALTSTVAAFACDGESAVHTLVEVHLTDVARPAANLNVVAAPSANPLPVIVTLVPPAMGPVLGLTLVTVGGLYL